MFGKKILLRAIAREIRGLERTAAGQRRLVNNSSAQAAASAFQLAADSLQILYEAHGGRK